MALFGSRKMHAKSAKLSESPQVDQRGHMAEESSIFIHLEKNNFISHDNTR